MAPDCVPRLLSFGNGILGLHKARKSLSENTKN
jgi:hypothetical protein